MSLLLIKGKLYINHILVLLFIQRTTPPSPPPTMLKRKRNPILSFQITIIDKTSQSRKFILLTPSENTLQIFNHIVSKYAKEQNSSRNTFDRYSDPDNFRFVQMLDDHTILRTIKISEKVLLDSDFFTNDLILCYSTSCNVNEKDFLLSYGKVYNKRY